MPEWNTSHGSRPRLPWIIRPIEAPYRVRPTYSWTRRRGKVACLQLLDRVEGGELARRGAAEVAVTSLQSAGQVAWYSIANCAIVDCMRAQYLPASTLAGLLGVWADGTGPAYRVLAERLRLLIADGRIMPGSRLPSERELTEALGVSRTTVASAYRELRDSGYLTSRRGSGSVTALPSKIEPELGRHHAPGIDTDGLYDFTCAAPAAVPGISTAVAAAAGELPAHLAHARVPPAGLAGTAGRDRGRVRANAGCRRRRTRSSSPRARWPRRRSRSGRSRRSATGC